MKNKKNKSSVLIILHVVSVFCIILWYISTVHRDNIANITTIQAKNGVWDLSECDFTNSIFELEGDMEYINGSLLSPNEFDTRGEEVQLGNLSVFEENVTIKGTIIFPSLDTYSLKINSLPTKTLYINDNFSGTNDISTYEDSISNFKHNEITSTFYPLDRQAELLIQSSDFIHESGDNSFRIYVGDPGLLDWYFTLGQQVQTVIIGMLFMLSLLHVIIFFTFEKSSLSIVTSVFCMIWSIRFGLEESRYLYALLPYFSWELGFRIINSAIPLSGIPIVCLVFRQFKGALSIRASLLIITIAVFAAIQIYVSSIYAMTHLTSVIIYIIYIILVIYLAYALLKYIRNKNRKEPLTFEQKIETVPFFILFYAVAHDSLNALGIHLFYIPYTITEMSVFYFAVSETLILYSSNILMKQDAMLKEHETRIEAQELKRFSKIKSQFMEIIAHEIKTPLAIINGGASESKDYLEDMMDKSMIEECHDEIDGIGRNQMIITKTVKDLNETVFDLLDATALETGRLSLNKSEVNLCNFIVSVMEQHRIQIEKANNELILEIPDSTEDIYCDEKRLRQVLINVLSNSIRYTKNGTIKVSLHVSEKFQEISITDSGVGISSDVLRRLKQKSYIDGGPHGNRGGIGIYVCHQIIESHHGILDIHSNNGLGTTVTISLPRISENID